MSEAQCSTSVTKQSLNALLWFSVFCSPAKSVTQRFSNAASRCSIQFVLHFNCRSSDESSGKFVPRTRTGPPTPPLQFQGNNTCCKNRISKKTNEVWIWKTSRLLTTCQKLMRAFWIIAPNINPLQCSPLILIYRTHTHTELCFMFNRRCLTQFLRFFLIPGGNKLKPTQTKKKTLEWRNDFPESCWIYLR